MPIKRLCGGSDEVVKEPKLISTDKRNSLTDLPIGRTVLVTALGRSPQRGVVEALEALFDAVSGVVSPLAA